VLNLKRQSVKALKEVMSMRTRRLLAKLGSQSRGRRKLREKTANNEILERVRRRVAKRKQELTRLLAKIARANTAKYSQGFYSRGMRVFFIVGRGRSGTTWLRSTLNSHPEILCWGEGRFLERSFKWEDFEQSQLKNIPPSSLYGAFLESKYLKAWVDRSVWATGKDTDRHLVNLTRLAIDYFLSEQLSKTGKKIVGDKTPFVSAEVVEEMSVIYPEAKVIHIIRDGRDVAVSLIHHMWNNAKNEGGIYDLEPEELEKRSTYREGSFLPLAESLFTKERLISIATDWSTEIRKVMRDGPTLLGSNYSEVRYEDLLERPTEEVRRLLEFLGADASEEAAKRCVEIAGFERKSDRERGQEDSSSRYRKGVVGDWKNVFTEENKHIFKEIAGDLLIELGYEEDGSW